MSQGLGRIQRGCLRVIEEYRAAGKMPTTFNIAAEIYRVRPDRHGNRMVSDAQHIATASAREPAAEGARLWTARRQGLSRRDKDFGASRCGRPGRAVLPLVPKCLLTFRACLGLVCVRVRGSSGFIEIAWEGCAELRMALSKAGLPFATGRV